MKRLEKRQIFCLILALGATLRIGMILSGKSLWGDEFFSVQLAQQPVRQILWGSVQDVHPPFFFLLLHLMVSLFGTSEYIFRSVSLLCGIALIIFAYWTGRRLFGQRVGLVVAFSIAISPYWLQNAHEIRGYALLALLVTASFYGLLRFWEEAAHLRWFYLYILTTVLAVYTEHYAWFWVLAGWGLLLFANKHLRAQMIITALGLPSLALIFYQSQNSEPVFSLTRLSQYWEPIILLKKWVGIYWHFASGHYYTMLTSQMLIKNLKGSVFFWITALNAASCVLLLGYALKRLRPQNFRYFFVFAFMTLLPATLLLVIYPVRLDSRYLSFSAPFVFILCAWGWTSLRDGRLRLAVAAVFLGVSLQGSLYALQLKTDVIHRDDFVGMTRYVFDRASERDIVCGLGPIVGYYERKGVFSRRSPYYADYKELSAQLVADVHSIWVFDAVNMHPEVARLNFDAVDEYLQKLGFRSVQEPVRFGGDQGLLVAYLFQKKG